MSSTSCARPRSDIDSLLGVRNGYLVVEEYSQGSSAEHLHTLQSDGTSITSLLVGIALEAGPPAEPRPARP